MYLGADNLIRLPFSSVQVYCLEWWGRNNKKHKRMKQHDDAAGWWCFSCRHSPVPRSCGFRATRVGAEFGYRAIKHIYVVKEGQSCAQNKHFTSILVQLFTLAEEDEEEEEEMMREVTYCGRQAIHCNQHIRADQLFHAAYIQVQHIRKWLSPSIASTHHMEFDDHDSRHRQCWNE